MRLTILSRFLRLLEFLEDITNFFAFLGASKGITAVVCLCSYSLLVWGRCDSPTAAILATAIAMTAYSLVEQPNA